MTGMKDSRQIWYDPEAKVSVAACDVVSAAQALANGHIAGPVAAHYLAKALALVSLLGAEADGDGETVSIQMKCSGPLGGWNVEYSAGGFLRGYTEKKILDDFDGLGRFTDAKVLGETQMHVVLMRGGRILSEAVAVSPDEYLAVSLQRKARVFLEAEVGDDVRVGVARGVLVEALPDSSWEFPAKPLKGLSRSPRTLLSELGLKHAELKGETPLAFRCTCSQERAGAMLAALSPEEREGLPGEVAITCHMCGKTYMVPLEQSQRQ